MCGSIGHAVQRAGYAALCVLAGMTGCAHADGPRVSVSPAATMHEAGLVDVGALIDDANVEMRYAGAHNFVGQPINGYLAPKCYLLEPVAQAVKQVADDLRPTGLRLHFFDCYRPVRAVKQFVSWSRDLDDQQTKSEFYPNLDKSALLNVYIAESSGHSRGATLDVGLEDCSVKPCAPLDMGTAFDMFDPKANTQTAGLTPLQQRNRQTLLQAMARRGLRNYPMEWWHYTYQPEPTPQTAYDVPVE